MLGLPCFSADHAAIDRAAVAHRRHAGASSIDADVETGVVTAGALRLTATVPQAFRDAFLSGQWNPTSMLLDKFDEVRAVANRLPYVSGF